MALAFGVLVIVMVLLIHCIGLIKSSLKSLKVYQFLTEYFTADWIFRIVQYSSLIVTGSLEKGSSLMCDLSLGLNVRDFQRLTLIMSRSRKMIRFVRAPLLFYRIKNRTLAFNFTTKLDGLMSIEQMSRQGSDVADFIFFLTDHYGVFHWLGVFQNQKLASQLGTLGDYMWICCSLFSFVTIYCILQRNRIVYKNKEDLMKEREVKIALMDIFCHIMEVSLGFTFLYPNLARKEIIGVMAIASTTMRFCKFWVK